MKRSGGLERRTPMRRTAIKRSSTRISSSRVPHPPREFWSARREALYTRAGGLCERCGNSLDDHGMEAHHRKLRSQGGGHSMANLLALCPQCHRWCHGHPLLARHSGWIVPAAAQAAVTGVILHDGRSVRLTREGGYDVFFEAEGDAS